MLKNLQRKAPLGKKSEYITDYDRSLLFPVNRNDIRHEMGIDPGIFQGYDVWNCYEVSWLNNKGKPNTRIARIIYPYDSTYLVESKSLKLYLNSFNMTKLNTENDVIQIIQDDLSAILNTNVRVNFYQSDNRPFQSIHYKKEILIDHHDILISDYDPNPNLCVVSEAKHPEHEILSHLLKTNCPITGQPDWGTVYIKYFADKYILENSFLKYIISYRNAQGFHETCCEKIYTDIYRLIFPTKLLVKCYYTRRGGIDINPVRFMGYNLDENDLNAKAWRQ